MSQPHEAHSATSTYASLSTLSPKKPSSPLSEYSHSLPNSMNLNSSSSTITTTTLPSTTTTTIGSSTFPSIALPNTISNFSQEHVPTTFASQKSSFHPNHSSNSSSSLLSSHSLSGSGHDYQFYTSYHSFIHDAQARHALLHYLQSRQNDENILLVDDMFVMRDRVRRVVRNLFNMFGSTMNSSFQSLNTLNHSEWSQSCQNSSCYNDPLTTSSESTERDSFQHATTEMNTVVTKSRSPTSNSRHSDQSSGFISTLFSLKSPKSPKSPDQQAPTSPPLMNSPNSPPHSAQHLFSLHSILSSSNTSSVESPQNHHHSRHSPSNNSKSKSAFSSKSSTDEFLNYENNTADSPTLAFRRSSNAGTNNSFSSTQEEFLTPSQRFLESVNAMLQSVDLIYCKYVNDNEYSSTNVSLSCSSIQNYDLSSVKFISLNTTHNVLDHARKDYNILTKIFHNTRCSFSNQDSLLENVMRFCNYMLYEKDHKLSEKDLEKLKKIVIADECLMDTLNDHIHSNEDIDSLLKQEMFAQFKWYPFRDLMTNISQQLQVESFDEFKSTAEFEMFIRKQIHQLNSHYMYKLFVQNVGAIPAVDMNVGDYVLSKKKKRKSIVDVLLRRKGNTSSNDSNSDASSSSFEDAHHHHSHKSTPNETCTLPLQEESFVNALQHNYNSILMAMDHCDLKEWMSPIPIPKWTSAHVCKFLVNNCYFGGDGAVEEYCDRVQKKNISGLDLMCVLEVNQISKASKETSQLFKTLKMKNHDHQQRFISNLKEFLQNQTKFRRKHSLLYPDLYQPLVNDEHIIIKVLSPLTDESRVFSVERSIPFEKLQQRIEHEFSNTKLAILMEGALFELKSLYTSEGNVIKDQFQLSQYLASEHSNDMARRVSTVTTNDMGFEDIREESSMTDSNETSSMSAIRETIGIASDSKLQQQQQQDDGFKKLYIQPSCDKKFQRRMVVY
ncbi:hypothetical protein C9374_007601 [Naegleria lovaniensis]|uniref:RGS domain-containing protein n=1 Tax=Naegleria lovaniensis TaxID=51637 RepID=A0AA88GI14_NAELO|nr:uncharacterized protein C9374_007601 [Naegleria lovaniensis]KAG2378963.1 hypothetical protein C9374_007601 [Naegleria lovaniensis]